MAKKKWDYLEYLEKQPQEELLENIHLRTPEKEIEAREERRERDKQRKRDWW